MALRREEYNRFSHESKFYRNVTRKTKNFYNERFRCSGSTRRSVVSQRLKDLEKCRMSQKRAIDQSGIFQSTNCRNEHYQHWHREKSYKRMHARIMLRTRLLEATLQISFSMELTSHTIVLPFLDDLIILTKGQ